MVTLKELLKGTTKEGQKFFDTLFINKSNTNICWYPSAGEDFRDILELTNIIEHVIDKTVNKNLNIAFDYSIDNLPDIFIHTDYRRRSIDLSQGKIFNDKETNVQIQIQQKHRLIINKKFPIEYWGTCSNEIPPQPEIYLLDIKISSNILEEINKPVIYFFFENKNFLKEVLLKYRINISHIVKIREGIGLGGGHIGASISIAYAFLSILKTKYLIIDKQISFNDNLFDELKKKYKLELKDFDLEPINPTTQITTPITWSDFNVNIWKVNLKNNDLTKQRIKTIFQQLSPKNYQEEHQEEHQEKHQKGKGLTTYDLDELFPMITEEESKKRDEEYKDMIKKEILQKSTQRPDGKYDVNGNVDISNINLQKLTDFPIQFGKVRGNFYCHKNKLTTLQGSPEEVEGNFWCYDNPKKFTKKDVRKYCKVKGQIYVKWYKR